MKLAVAVLCLAVTYARAGAQRECWEHTQCHDNQFCAELIGKCTECVPCAEYHRTEVKACAETVEECGPCLQGFTKVYNKQECVDELAPTSTASPGDGGGGGGMAAYVWVPILAVILILLVALFFVWVRWIRPKIFTTTTRESIYNTRFGDAEAPLRASSPSPHDTEQPYHPAINNNHQPSSPPYEKSDDDSAGHRPFMIAKDAMSENAGKETDNNQEARPFSFPNYVRAPYPSPPTYEEALEEESNPAAEDDTVPSSWTPEPAAGGDSSNLSVLLREARDRTIIRQPDRSRDSSPPSKLPRLPTAEDSEDDAHSEITASPARILPALPAATDVGSNLIPLVSGARTGNGTNAHRAERPAGSGRSPSPAPSPPTASTAPRETNIVINITQQLNNLVTPKFKFDNEQR